MWASQRDRVSWAGDLARPVPLIATGVLAVNDHVLKGSGWLPGAVTGKLSDVAGLFVAAILAVALARGIAQRCTGALPRRDGRLAALSIVGVVVAFVLLKASPAVNGAVNAVWGPHVLDPGDLYCLPIVLLAWVWLADRDRATCRSTGRFGSALAFAAALLVCAATPKAPPVPPPQVPMWSIAAKPLDLPCGTAEAWIAKSGKTGVGLTVRVTPRTPEATCEVSVSANFKFPDRSFAGTLVVAMPSPELPPREHELREAIPDHLRHPIPANATFHYLAFELDNEARWNRGQRQAIVELVFVLGGNQKLPFTLPATHAFTEFPIGTRE